MSILDEKVTKQEFEKATNEIHKKISKIYTQLKPILAEKEAAIKTLQNKINVLENEFKSRIESLEKITLSNEQKTTSQRVDISEYKKQKLTDKDEDLKSRIVELRNGGLSLREIGVLESISHTTVKNILKSAGINIELENSIKKVLYEKQKKEPNLVKNKHYHDFYGKLNAGEIDILEVPKLVKEVESMEQMKWENKNFEFFLNETSPNGQVNVELNGNSIDSFNIGYVVYDHMDFKEHCKGWLDSNENKYTVKPKNDSRGIVGENKDTSNTNSLFQETNAFGVKKTTGFGASK